jgi:hypothetical protein
VGQIFTPARTIAPGLRNPSEMVLVNGLYRIWRYWLLDSNGKEVGEIGNNESDVKEFKAEFNGHFPQ